MSLRVLRVIAIAGPVAFAIGLGFLTDQVLERTLADHLAHIVATVIVALGVTIFALWIFGLLNEMYRQLEQRRELERQRAEEWKALFEVGKEVTASPDLQGVLQSVVERAARLLGSDVAALMLLEPDEKYLRMTAHVGMHTAGMEQLRLLAEHGLQGYVLETGKPAVVHDYQSDPRLRNRPARLVAEEGMVSAISVPFSVKGRVLGTLSVGNRQRTEFSERHAELLAAFANWAAVAVETSALYDQVESLARLEERDRIAMDLHDGIIQSIYAVGLNLEEVAERAGESPDRVRERLDTAIDSLNAVIRDIRSYIFDLRPEVSQVPDLSVALNALVQEVRINTLMDVTLDMDGEVEQVSEEQGLALYHIVQEALNNVAKHAKASSAAVRLRCADGHVRIEVTDNGVGFVTDEQTDGGKQGLRNMTDRARSVGAHLQIRSAPGQGTRVRVELPLTEGEGE
ncbi:MAG: GAF domain-containing protein [Chloroflexi bacterium]|nr:GAF domain-containing protein [Chloroflexota bacterium]